MECAINCIVATVRAGRGVARYRCGGSFSERDAGAGECRQNHFPAREVQYSHRTCAGQIDYGTGGLVHPRTPEERPRVVDVGIFSPVDAPGMAAGCYLNGTDVDAVEGTYRGLLIGIDGAGVGIKSKVGADNVSHIVAGTIAWWSCAVSAANNLLSSQSEVQGCTCRQTGAYVQCSATQHQTDGCT